MVSPENIHNPSPGSTSEGVPQEKTPVLELIKEEELALLVPIFIESFNDSEAGVEWDEESALKYLKYWYEHRPDLFFIARVDDKLAGGVVGEIMPLWDGPSLANVDLFVGKNHRGLGISRKLFEEIIQAAIRNHDVTHVRFIADGTKDFPLGWYKKSGFAETGWVHMSGDASEVLQNFQSRE